MIKIQVPCYLRKALDCFAVEEECLDVLQRRSLSASTPVKPTKQYDQSRPFRVEKPWFSYVQNLQTLFARDHPPLNSP
ncbi:hypothetical protein H671_3g8695 [Cricetulus griseus]|nr:hypothetical protein H671_3g8695 [Cricetulus griseus]